MLSSSKGTKLTEIINLIRSETLFIAFKESLGTRSCGLGEVASSEIQDKNESWMTWSCDKNKR